MDRLLRARAQVGVAARRGVDQTEARRELESARLEKAIKDALDSDTPPTQRDRDLLASRLLSEGPL